MTKIGITEHKHSAYNQDITKYLELWGGIGDLHIKFKLDDRLKERNLSIRDFSKLSGLRLGTINDLKNGKKTAVSFQHIWIIMLTLGITNINDLIEFYIPQELKDCMNKASELWISDSENIPFFTTVSREVVSGKESISPDIFIELFKYLY